MFFRKFYQLITNPSSRRAAFQRVFNTPDGEVVLRLLAEQGCVSSPTHVKGDPEQSLINEGKRQMVLAIIKEVRGPVDVPQFIQEQLEYDHRLNSELSDGR